MVMLVFRNPGYGYETVSCSEYLSALDLEFPEGFTAWQALDWTRRWVFINQGKPAFFCEMYATLRQLKSWGFVKELKRLRTGKRGRIVYAVVNPSIPPAPKEAGILEGVL